MHLLIATDHRFLQDGTTIHDTYCFDRDFFADYLRVFETVEVICRLARVNSLPCHSFQSNGDRLHFRGVPDVHGARWVLRAGSIARPSLREAVQNADAIIARVPSELGWHAARAGHRIEKPFMIEVIGDPAEAVKVAGKGLAYRIAGWRAAKQLQWLSAHATAGSYVSKMGLPQLYPVRPGRPSASISSIRLSATVITSPRAYHRQLQPLRVVSVGSLTTRKRTEDLVRACRRTLDAGVAVELHLAGDGPCRASLEALCRNEHIENAVVFHGHLPGQAKVFEFLDRADVFVMPSSSEGLPRAILEAMARGLPVIGARASGTSELVRPNELFPIGGVVEISNLLLDLLKSPKRLTEMSRYSIETARNYTNDKLSPRRIQLYTYLRQQTENRHAVPLSGQTPIIMNPL